MSNIRTFIDMAVAGRNPDIDDFVEQWHANNIPGTLSEYLGMTDDEYFRWIKDPECLQEIINGYRFSK